MDYAALFALVLLAVGIALLVAEVFIPSGGFILVLSVTSLIASVWFAWNAWGESYPAYWWSYLAALVLLIPSAFGSAFYFFPRTSIGRRILLEAPTPEEVAPYVREQELLSRLVGKRGRTVTMLGPGGMVLVEGERHHAETQGMLLDPDQEIEVVGLRSNRLLVRPAREPAPPDEPFGDDEEAAGRTPLDFDLPQG